VAKPQGSGVPARSAGASSPTRGRGHVFAFRIRPSRTRDLARGSGLRFSAREGQVVAFRIRPQSKTEDLTLSAQRPSHPPAHPATGEAPPRGRTSPGGQVFAFRIRPQSKTEDLTLSAQRPSHPPAHPATGEAPPRGSAVGTPAPGRPRPPAARVRVRIAKGDDPGPDRKADDPESNANDSTIGILALPQRWRGIRSVVAAELAIREISEEIALRF
jgi:hypothetical protein